MNSLFAHCHCHVRCEQQCKSTCKDQGSFGPHYAGEIVPVRLHGGGIDIFWNLTFENTALFLRFRPTVHTNVMKMEFLENTLQTRGI